MGALKTSSARFAVVGLVALLLAVGLLAGRWWGQAGQTGAGRAPDALHVAPDCDVGRRPCTAAAPGSGAGLGLSLAIGPGLSAMEAFPIRLRVMTAERVPSDIVLSFSMVGMDMGRNRYRLLQADSGASSAADGGVGDWQGRATLPLCATGRRDWTAELTVTMATGRVYRGVFPFVVE